jgi:acyl-CoA reductase-like NAD-dependent aldehyde dehydrogenase
MVGIELLKAVASPDHKQRLAAQAAELAGLMAIEKGRPTTKAARESVTRARKARRFLQGLGQKLTEPEKRKH